MSACTTRLPASPELADQHLLEQAYKGDQHAFEALVQRYQVGLYQFVKKYLGSEDAQDVLQDTWLQLYLSLPKLLSAYPSEDEQASLRGWLYRVAHNRCIDVWRKRKRDGAAQVFSLLLYTWEQQWGKEGESPLFELPDPAPLPEELAERAETQDQLQTLISALPPKMGAVLWLRYTQTLDFQSIAAILQIPTNTAKICHYRGCKRLRALLRAREGPLPVK